MVPRNSVRGDSSIQLVEIYKLPQRYSYCIYIVTQKAE